MRFIINLPREELQSVERICFQVEEAQWFYEDFIRPLDPGLPSLNLRDFCLLIFQHCPIFSAYSAYHHAQAFQEFLAYKTRVPVRGAIMLNENMDEVVLVKGWKKGANWSFPRGKINKDEPDLACAIREVYEETGYDIKAAGLVEDEKASKYIEMNLREQHMRLYVFRGVPMDTCFEPRTRKEISKINWWKLADLPTLKKKKNQQEGRGEDLAINANKFYMVAPFLPQLKKWISIQRKLDKARREEEAPTTLNAIDEDYISVEIPEANGVVTDAPSNNDFGLLVNNLRHSAQPVNTSEPPGTSQTSAETTDLTAQLKSFLGVQSSESSRSINKPLLNTSSTPEVFNNAKANGLLALLQSKPPIESTRRPQTPMGQVIEQPSEPRSPPHPHHQPPRFSTLPPPPALPIPPTQDPATMAHFQQPQPPQTRPIPPPQQPAQLIPRAAHPLHQKSLPRPHGQQPAMAPYQRTGDPQFAQYHQGPGKQLPSIPPASKLPPPRLNAQSSALLNLFKSGQSTKASAADGGSKEPGLPSQQPLKAIPPTDPRTDGILSNETIAQPRVQQLSRQSSTSGTLFVPPQVSPNAHVAKTNEVIKPKSEHHDKLLSLFRTPSMPSSEPSKTGTTSLQPQLTPVELSALPATPNHSRETSQRDASPHKLPPTVQIQKPTKQNATKQNATKHLKPAVSATVNGPLNVPQFEVLSKIAKEHKQPSAHNGYPQPQKRSPITILARPGSSRAPASVGLPKMATEGIPLTKQEKAFAPRLQTFVTPTKDQPPTPNLKGQDGPAKTFQPQILRRPAHTQDLNEPSPIQPLPSPQQRDFTDRRSAQPADHKKSLLSLFTQPSPSPIISPLSAVRASAIDPTIDSNNIISPLPPTPTPQQQADAAFARLKKTVGPLSQPDDTSSGFPTRSVLKLNDISSAMAEGLMLGESSEKPTPTPTPAPRTAPKDKEFLLGYLEGVARGAR